MAAKLSKVPRQFWLGLDLEGQSWFTNLASLLQGYTKLAALNADPADPPSGESVIWQSTGVDSGDDGDIMLKITDTSGTTKTGTLVDFSAL